MESDEAKQLRTERVGERIAGLPAKDRASLLKIWEEVFPAPPPHKLRKELMVPILAYRIQELAFGGLSQTARRQLELLIAKNRMAITRMKKHADPEIQAKLVRCWRGEFHEVLIVDDGYIYRGETYRSLSPIARRITGTQWSGPAFFGTKGRQQ